MANLLDAMKPVAHDGLNGFDRGARDVYSGKPGIAIPLRPIDTVPHSHYKIDLAQVCETTTLQTNAFARGRQNVDYYFVPYSQIFHRFFEVYTGRGEEKRAHVAPQDFQSVTMKGLPYVDSYYLVCWLLAQYLLRVKSHKYSPTLVDEGNIYFSQSELLPRGSIIKDIHNNNCIIDILRLLDNLEYGNYIPVFQQFVEFIGYCISVNEGVEFTNFEVSNDYVLFERDGVQVDFEAFFNEFCLKLTSSAAGSTGGDHWNIFRICAYQKVWVDMMRNFEYTSEIVCSSGNKYDLSYAYSLDYINPSNLHILDYFDSIQDFAECMLMPRYVLWKKDLFTQHYPTTQFGNVAAINYDDFELLINNGVSAGAPLQATSVGHEPKAVTGSNLPDAAARFRTSPVISFSALDVRLTMAQQRWRERILRASNRQKDLLKATFGVESKFVDDEYCVYLGSFDGTLNINRVQSTAKTENGDIGELGAYGTSGLNGRTIECTTSDFGIIIPMYSFVPEGEYNSYGISPFNLKLDGDSYFKQDFENLGLQPVYRHELYNLPVDLASYNEDDVIGYTVANHEYKTEVDKVHGLFFSQLPFNGDEFEGQKTFGAFADYVTPRDLRPFIERDQSAFYVSSHCMDNIFLVSVEDEYMETDCFKMNFYQSVKASQPMNVTGLPSL